MKKFQLATYAFIALFFIGCSNDDAVPVNEEELITTVTVTMAPEGGGQSITMIYRDLDGDGSGAPLVTVSGTLETGTVYAGSVQLLNESVTPAEDITEEIIEEAEDHQFFYGIPQGLGSIVYSAPFDANGHPIGTNFILTTNSTGTGNLTVVLRHEPNKSAANVAQGDITNAGGETDVEVSFPITIQ